LNKQINIIGSGASGLLCAILLSKNGFNVSIFEKNKKAGRKILATGNGKCNITNKNLSNDNFFSSISKFPRHAIEQLSYRKLEKLFNTLGLELIQGEGTKMYPMSLQASSVTDILYNEAKINGVKFYFDTFIEDVSSKKNKFFIVDYHNTYESDILIVCSGSAAMQKLGSSDSGYKFAKFFGHKVVDTFSSLVQLQSNDTQISSLSGVKTHSNVKLYINKNEISNVYGDILFTSYGLSGNSILDISRNASYGLLKNKNIEVLIDILPDITKDKLISILNKRKELLKEKTIEFLLESIINKKLIPYIYKKALIQKFKLSNNQLDKKDLINIAYQLKNIRVNITSTKGFESAEVVAGGIDVNDVDNKTMQSKLKKDLYFCGEVLDVDGACGGYNLHWAWASAYCCSNAIFKL